jgi:hypothetical protein
MKLTDLVNANLVGGTLVEYWERRGFSDEFGRATIDRVGFLRREAVGGKLPHPSYFEIRTKDGEACMGLDLDVSSEPDVLASDGVFMWQMPGGYGGSWYYAAAPAGVEIAPPPAMQARWNAAHSGAGGQIQGEPICERCGRSYWLGSRPGLCYECGYREPRTE